MRLPPSSTLFPYTTLFRSDCTNQKPDCTSLKPDCTNLKPDCTNQKRSEEHTLNSSHVRISYAVFCLKKKKNPSVKPNMASDNAVVYLALSTTQLPCTTPTP